MKHQWLVTCPKCGRVSLRSAVTRGTERPVCKHEYHAPEDCGTCGECRNAQPQTVSD